MLDQDPDALIAIDERMKPEDYGVTAIPKGADGKAFPSIGYAGWSMFTTSKAKPESWKLIAHLSGLAANIEWNKRIGALPIYKSAEKDPFYAQAKFKGWFDELADPNVQPTSMPTYLEEFGYFADSIVPKSSQEALLGRKSAEQVGKEWSDYLTKAQKKYLATQK